MAYPFWNVPGGDVEADLLVDVVVRGITSNGLRWWNSGDCIGFDVCRNGEMTPRGTRSSGDGLRSSSDDNGEEHVDVAALLREKSSGCSGGSGYRWSALPRALWPQKSRSGEQFASGGKGSMSMTGLDGRTGSGFCVSWSW